MKSFATDIEISTLCLVLLALIAFIGWELLSSKRCAAVAAAMVAALVTRAGS